MRSSNTCTGGNAPKSKNSVRAAKARTEFSESLWRRHPDLNRGVKVLQTFALPLGYSAVLSRGGL